MALDPSMPVLVVDNSGTMINIQRNLLRQLGFNDIDDAQDGPAALAKMRDRRYGLVISDWNMEPMSGYDFLREVRSDPILKRTPFIIVTAEAKTEHVIAAKKGRREQLHSQAVQCGISKDEDRSRVCSEDVSLVIVGVAHCLRCAPVNDRNLE